MILHEDGVVIEPPEAGRAQTMRQAIAARLELAIGDRFARSRHHDGRLIDARASVLAWVHPLLPRWDDRSTPLFFASVAPGNPDCPRTCALSRRGRRAFRPGWRTASRSAEGRSRRVHGEPH